MNKSDDIVDWWNELSYVKMEQYIKRYAQELFLNVDDFLLSDEVSFTQILRLYKCTKRK